MTTNMHVQKQQLRTPIALFQALGLVLLIILGEYSARRFVAPWLPTIGAWHVNDMLVSAVCYVLLVILTTSSAKRHFTVFWQELWEIAAQTCTQSSWVWASLLIGTSWLSVIETWLWRGIHLPEWFAPSTPLILFQEAGPVLEIISLLLVNGLLVPCAEERLWRGLMQLRLIAWIGFPFGLGLTALLFSLKHVIIDASMERFLTLFLFGLLVGFMASRSSWKHSAWAHSVANTFATVIFLLK